MSKMIQKRTTYSWRMNSSGRGNNPDISSRVPAGVIEDCNISVEIWGSTIVVLQKTNPKPIMVDINLRFSNIIKERRSYKWETSLLISGEWRIPLEPFNVVCDVTWTLPEPRASPEENTGLSSLTPLPALVLPTENFLMNPSFSDVTIVIGKKELPANKLVLAGHSPVFFQMLSTPMQEALNNRVVIKDIDFNTMKTVLTLLYTGKYEALSDVPVACNVLGAAHKYDIQRLIDACIYHLYKKLDAKTVLQILKTADLYGLEKLKQECWDLIIKNKKEIIPTAQFEDFCVNNRGLMHEFMIEMAKASP